ncbi:MAG: Stp1/IreP family PP2C-type Ser/Thr phosphatase [Eubacteriales bacterium]
MKIVAKSDIGKLREQNQDACAASELPGGVTWAVVCDGMGGAAGGSVASTVAVRIISEKINSCFKQGMSTKSIHNMLISAIEVSNIAIYDMAKSDDTLTGMGTTVVTAVVIDNSVCIASAGDSRAYLATKQELKQITRDHSIVQVMVEKGEITPEEAKDHPRKNIITRALGVDESISIDYYEEKISNDDILLICTDGLTNFIENDEILNIIGNNSYYDIADKLIDFANQNGGGDNITVVTISS